MGDADDDTDDEVRMTNLYGSLTLLARLRSGKVGEEQLDAAITALEVEKMTSAKINAKRRFGTAAKIWPGALVNESLKWLLAQGRHPEYCKRLAAVVQAWKDIRARAQYELPPASEPLTDDTMKRLQQAQIDRLKLGAARERAELLFGEDPILVNLIEAAQVKRTNTRLGHDARREAAGFIQCKVRLVMEEALKWARRGRRTKVEAGDIRLAHRHIHQRSGMRPLVHRRPRADDNLIIDLAQAARQVQPPAALPVLRLHWLAVEGRPVRSAENVVHPPAKRQRRFGNALLGAVGLDVEWVPREGKHILSQEEAVYLKKVSAVLSRDDPAEAAVVLRHCRSGSCVQGLVPYLACLAAKLAEAGRAASALAQDHAVEVCSALVGNQAITWYPWADQLVGVLLEVALMDGSAGDAGLPARLRAAKAAAKASLQVHAAAPGFVDTVGQTVAVELGSRVDRSVASKQWPASATAAVECLAAFGYRRGVARGLPFLEKMWRALAAAGDGQEEDAEVALARRHAVVAILGLVRSLPLGPRKAALQALQSNSLRDQGADELVATELEIVGLQPLEHLVSIGAVADNILEGLDAEIEASKAARIHDKSLMLSI
mmetsp:Transcript_9237/g.20003  ORF Transcript_9237/g.20003 Transcript_9237/m.20003 type:complete len:604 (+) Transcript_9237:19-1830(+)